MYRPSETSLLEPISPQDKPLSPNLDSTTSGSKSNDLVPGTTHLRQKKGKGTGWYCGSCTAFVYPIFIRRGDTIYPACLECFYDDLSLCNGSVGEIEYVETLESPISPDTSGLAL